VLKLAHKMQLTLEDMLTSHPWGIVCECFVKKKRVLFLGKLNLRDGREKNFLSPITTKPWGESIPKLGDLEVPDQNALDSQLLCFEPDALNVDTGLPVISKDKLKEGVYY
jgi:Adenosine-5''-phosphosulfate reductase beta subunit;.